MKRIWSVEELSEQWSVGAEERGKLPDKAASGRFSSLNLRSSVLALHLLQACLVYVNTLMLQRVLEELAWLTRMIEADMRGLNPLVYLHVTPYGRHPS
jgi:hypothetical protein